jgi:hypothetical protein
MVLTLGTTAVPTGQGLALGLAASGATHVQFPRLRCTASPDGVEGLQMRGQETVGVFVITVTVN